MIRFVIHFASDAGDRASPGDSTSGGWIQELAREKIEVEQFADSDAALRRARNGQPLGVVLDGGLPHAQVIEFLRALMEFGLPAELPVLASFNQFTPDDDAIEKFVEAGLNGIILNEAPARIAAGPILIYAKLAELRDAEPGGKSAGELAAETREIVHTLCQPLTTVQGRLQLLAMKAGDGDEHKEKFDQLASLMLEASRHLAELQELHRKNS